jgi:hypothetical protein
MASKRIDELDARTVADADLLPVTPSGGPSGKATVAAIVAEGLSQPNSASSGAGASLSIIAADGVTSGAGGSIILEPGAQATTGGNGTVIVRQPGGTAGTNELQMSHGGTDASISNLTTGNIFVDVGRGGSLTALRVRRADVLTRFVSIEPDATGGSRIHAYNNFILDANTGANFVRLRGTVVQITDSSNLADCAISRASVSIIKVSNTSTGGGSLAYTSSTPAAITANQNDYVLTGSAFQRLNCTTAADITGIAPPTGGAHVDGRMIRLVSVGAETVTLKHNDSDSAAANRIYMSSGNHLALAVNEWADLVYDSTDNGSGAAGWRVVKYA